MSEGADGQPGASGSEGASVPGSGEEPDEYGLTPQDYCHHEFDVVCRWCGVNTGSLEKVHRELNAGSALGSAREAVKVIRGLMDLYLSENGAPASYGPGSRWNAALEFLDANEGKWGK